ncbi:MAG: RNA polymerase sigma factor [Chloroflexota bacterium]|nr:RNA polymerase sigma factor [Chloroflexota bacterium]
MLADILKILREQDVIDRGDMKVADSTSQSYEAKLVKKLRSGDSAAMEEFYNIYRSRLYTLILDQVDRNQAVAEDLVQETFLAALDSLDKFRGDSQLYTWLRSIAFHKINDFYRRQGRQPKPKESWPDFDVMKQLEQTRDDKPAAFTVMESEEIRQSVHKALGDLPQDYQEVLVLKYLEEMPVLEISQVMGRSPKSVEGLLSRARKAMRASLENNNHGA